MLANVYLFWMCFPVLEDDAVSGLLYLQGGKKRVISFNTTNLINHEDLILLVLILLYYFNLKNKRLDNKVLSPVLVFCFFHSDFGLGFRLLVNERHPQWLRSHVISLQPTRSGLHRACSPRASFI